MERDRYLSRARSAHGAALGSDVGDAGASSRGKEPQCRDRYAGRIATMASGKADIDRTGEAHRSGRSYTCGSHTRLSSAARCV